MPQASLSANKNLEIGDTGDGVVGTMRASFRSSDWTGKTVTPKGRKRGTTQSFENVAYRRHDTDAVVAGGTAIAGNMDISIEAPGMELRLDYVQGGGGQATDVAWEPFSG